MDMLLPHNHIKLEEPKNSVSALAELSKEQVNIFRKKQRYNDFVLQLSLYYCNTKHLIVPRITTYEFRISSLQV